MVASGEDPFKDNDVDDEVEEEYELGIFEQPRKWSWTDSAYLFAGLANNVAASFAMWFGNVAAQISAHEMHKRTHQDFAEDVMKDIRRL